MINPVSNITQPEAVAQTTPTPKSSQSEPHAPTAVDSVQISNAAQAALASLQELKETSAQTANEARHGDLQAQRLLAKEVAAKSEIEKPLLRDRRMKANAKN